MQKASASDGTTRASKDLPWPGQETTSSTDVHSVAERGVSGVGTALPYRETIQKSFGAHDVSGVCAHLGGEAARASQAIDATAYATGSDVAFATSPSLHTAAHEAAHVVQQRAGVQLKGGVGEVGDSYEQHANAVADQVVQGKPAESMLDQMAGSSSTGGSTTRGTSVQRFGSLEHKSLGDNPTNKTEYDLGGHNAGIDASEYNRAFHLTHGDIVMLSGDFFSPRDTRVNSAGQEEPDPDSLFLLAAIPSLNPGQNVGTWDEVVYAIKKAIPSDPRFEQQCTPEMPEGHPWSRVTFSAEVIRAVEARYLRRAAANDEHFVDPNRTSEGAKAGDGRSAGGSYHALHEAAILLAYDQGSVANASAREAAAQHFLTDHFAAGHLRTPRGSIRAYWSAIYPLFWDNLRNKIALDVATWINDNDRIGYVATVDQIYADVQETVLQQTADIPPMGFDDLVSLVAHDFDNENGLWVTNDIGVSWKLYGDGNLDNQASGNRTREMCEAAVVLGLEDIKAAAAMGAAKGENAMTAEQVLDSIRSATGRPAAPHASKYGSEQLLPRLDLAHAGENGTQNWQQPNFDSLWDAPVHSGISVTDETYGKLITESMKGGELRHEMTGMAEKFPETQNTVEVFTVHPRNGFLQGFLAPFVANPRLSLLGILNFSPSRGQASFNQDDAVMRELNGKDSKGGMTPEHLAGLTLEQKSERIRALVSGFWNYCGEDEGETVVQLFNVTPAGQRRTLYEMVEGHRWEGDFHHGIFTTDDDLWDSLDSGQLDRLKAIIGD